MGPVDDPVPFYFGGSNSFESAHANLYAKTQFVPSDQYNIDTTPQQSITDYEARIADRKTGAVIVSAKISCQGQDIVYMKNMFKDKPYLIEELKICAMKDKITPAPSSVFQNATIGAFNTDGGNISTNEDIIGKYLNPSDADNFNIVIPAAILMDGNNGFYIGIDEKFNKYFIFVSCKMKPFQL